VAHDQSNEEIPTLVEMDEETSLTLLENCISKHDKHNNNCELEFRLGMLDVDTGRFTAGVKRETFDQMERDMSDILVGDRLWSEIVDYYYLNDDGNTMRTRVMFDSKQMKMNMCNIRKENLNSMIVCREDDTQDACRVTSSIEHPIDEPPTSCIVNYVRVQQRRRFYDIRDGKSIWMFELSKTWSASSREAVEFQQHNTEPNYEIECELIDEDNAYSNNKSTREIAESILMKIKILLGDEIDGRVVVHNPTQTRRRRNQNSRNRRQA